MQPKYEYNENIFWIEDPSLGLFLQEKIERLEKKFDPETGLLVEEQGKKRDKLHGPSCYFAKTGLLLSKSWFFEGTPIGEHKKYYITGALYSIERFLEGKFHLTQEYYYSDGALKTQSSYSQGTLEGKTVLFWPNRKKKREILFEKGEKIQDTLFNEEGHVITEMAKTLSRN